MVFAKVEIWSQQLAKSKFFFQFCLQLSIAQGRIRITLYSLSTHELQLYGISWCVFLPSLCVAPLSRYQRPDFKDFLLLFVDASKTFQTLSFMCGCHYSLPVLGNTMVRTSLIFSSAMIIWFWFPIPFCLRRKRCFCAQCCSSLRAAIVASLCSLQSIAEHTYAYANKR